MSPEIPPVNLISHSSLYLTQEEQHTLVLQQMAIKKGIFPSSSNDNSHIRKKSRWSDAPPPPPSMDFDQISDDDLISDDI